MVNRIAVDIGASGGRVMLGQGNGMHELHRFPNEMTKIDGQLCWNLDTLEHEIRTGINKAETLPHSVGVCTWGVDFVLLDDAGHRLGNAVAYRDNRTQHIRQKVHAIVSEMGLYARTGMQPMVFNTIYQLAALQEHAPHLLQRAAYLLMIPDYFHYRLCGAITQEYTNATTTGLVNAHTRTWDWEIIERLGLPAKLFIPLARPGTIIGQYAPGCAVTVPATHDTASAVATAMDGAIYISSGTWSLMGITLAQPNTSEAARIAGFSNEGGMGGAIVFCKNIMGLWMIQNVQRELRERGEDYTYATLCDMAEAADISGVVDCEDARFFSPVSMIAQLQAACAERGQAVPHTPGELARVVYQSLATGYAKTAKQIESLTGQRYDKINIIGGGAKSDLLNRLTQAQIGKQVVVGSYEATSMGNLMAQANN